MRLIRGGTTLRCSSKIFEFESLIQRIIELNVLHFRNSFPDLSQVMYTRNTPCHFSLISKSLSLQTSQISERLDSCQKVLSIFLCDSCFMNPHMKQSLPICLIKNFFLEAVGRFGVVTFGSASFSKNLRQLLLYGLGLNFKRDFSKVDPSNSKALTG